MLASPSSIDVRLTNRSQSLPNFEGNESHRTGIVGVDTIRLRGVLARRPSSQTWGSFYSSRNGSASTDISRTVQLRKHVMLIVNLRDEVPTAAFEFSVPNYVKGNNLAPSSVTDVMNSTEDLWFEACRFVEWATPFDELEIMRLDATLDFLSPSAATTTSLLDGLRSLDVPYHPPTVSYEHHKELTSVRVGSGKRWKTTIYAKDEEILSRVAKTHDRTEKSRLRSLAIEAEGQVRCEVLTRKAVLKERGIITLADLNTQNIASLHRSFFERAGFGATVGSKRWAAMFKDADEQTKKVLDPAISMLLREANGCPIQASANSLAKYKKIAKLHGLTVADFMPGASTNSVHLDYANALLRTEHSAT